MKMVEKYFETSQRVKREIASLESMLEKARQAFDGQQEYMAAGGSVKLYAMGALPSGFYVALRIFRKDMPEGQYDLNFQKKLMEQYCKNAEDLHSDG